MATTEEHEQEMEVQKWRVKKLIKSLEQAAGNGTSMITLQLTPKDQIALATQKLNQEYGTAENIKSHVNKLSVLSAIRSVLEKLKLYHRVPDNGLIIYCGAVMEGNKDKKVNIDLEPFKPVGRSLYWCGSRFDTTELKSMLESDDKFGFVVMDGSGSLFGTVCGNTREVLHKLTVELPKKHGRGGQSALRFARLRLEKRHNYLRKVAELATNYFITQDRPNVKGLVLAGSADFKNDLSQSDLFDQRLRPIVIKIVDVAYGGETGFNQAIELSMDALSGVRLVQEKKLINKFFDEIAKDSNLYCYGIDDTLRALEMGAVERLLVYEELDAIRLVTNDPSTETEAVYWVLPKNVDDPKYTKCESGQPIERTQELLVEWLAENYRRYGCALEFVTNKSAEGSQFVRGFGGLGGFLRYQVDFMQLREMEEEPQDDGGDGGDGGGGGHSRYTYDDLDEEDFM